MFYNLLYYILPQMGDQNGFQTNQNYLTEYEDCDVQSINMVR